MKLYLPASRTMKQATSHNFLTAQQSWGCWRLGTNPPRESLSELELFLLEVLHSLLGCCLTDIMAQLTFLAATTSPFIFHGSCYLPLPPTDLPLRECCNMWSCGSSGTATTQPLQPNSPATFIPSIPALPCFIYRDALFEKKAPIKVLESGWHFHHSFSKKRIFWG